MATTAPRTRIQFNIPVSDATEAAFARRLPAFPTNPAERLAWFMDWSSHLLLDLMHPQIIRALKSSTATVALDHDDLIDTVWLKTVSSVERVIDGAPLGVASLLSPRVKARDYINMFARALSNHLVDEHRRAQTRAHDTIDEHGEMPEVARDSDTWDLTNGDTVHDEVSDRYDAEVTREAIRRLRNDRSVLIACAVQEVAATHQGSASRVVANQLGCSAVNVRKRAEVGHRRILETTEELLQTRGCREFRPMIAAYLQARFLDLYTIKDRRAFVAHVAHCQSCRMVCEHSKQTMRGIASLPGLLAGLTAGTAGLLGLGWFTKACAAAKAKLGVGATTGTTGTSAGTSATTAASAASGATTATTTTGAALSTGAGAGALGTTATTSIGLGIGAKAAIIVTGTVAAVGAGGAGIHQAMTTPPRPKAPPVYQVTHAPQDARPAVSTGRAHIAQQAAATRAQQARAAARAQQARAAARAKAKAAAAARARAKAKARAKAQADAAARARAARTVTTTYTAPTRTYTAPRYTAPSAPTPAAPAPSGDAPEFGITP